MSDAISSLHIIHINLQKQDVKVNLKAILCDGKHYTGSNTVEYFLDELDKLLKK